MEFLGIDINQLSQWGIIIIAILYISWDIIKRLISKSEITKSATKQTKVLEKISNNLDKQSEINYKILEYLNTIQKTYSDELGDDQYRIFILRLTYTAKLRIRHFVVEIIEQNHLFENKDKVKEKIESFVNNLYQKDCIDLKQFKYKNTVINNFMEEVWTQEIVEGLINAIYGNEKKEDKIKYSSFFLKTKFQDIYNSFLNHLN